MAGIAAVSQFGYRDLFNTVVALTDGDPTTYWSFDNPLGLAHNSWIQLDFGRAVTMKRFRFLKNAGALGDFIVVASANPATNGSDAIGADDLQSDVLTDTQPAPDGPKINSFDMTFGGAYRYYRIMSAGAAPISSTLEMQEIEGDFAINVRQQGFTFSPSAGVAAVPGTASGFTALDPSTAGVGVMASLRNLAMNGNLVGQAANQAILGFASDALTAGKVYFEWKILGYVTGNSTGPGLAFVGALGADLGTAGGKGVIVYVNGNLYINGTFILSIGQSWTPGDTLAFAVDFTAHLLWAKNITKAGNWNGSGTANPATATGGFTIPSGQSWVPAAVVTAGQQAGMYFNPGLETFAGTVPSGFGTGWAGTGGAATDGTPAISANQLYNAADGDSSTTWTPLADTFAGAGALIPTPIAAQPAGNLPFIELDMGDIAPVAFVSVQQGAVTGGSSTGFTALDPAMAGIGYTLSGNNLLATHSVQSSDSSAFGFSKDAKKTGKFYIEWKHITYAGNDTGTGLAMLGAGSAGLGTAGTDGIISYSSGNLYINGTNTGSMGGAVVAGDVLAFAIDIGANLVWVKNLTHATNWNGSGTANPATGVGGRTIPSSVWVPACVSTAANATALQLNPGSIAFVGAVPAGFTGWTGTGGTSSGTSSVGLNDCHLIGSNTQAVDQAHVFNPGDVDLAQFTQAQMTSGTPLPTGIKWGEGYRYYRLIFGQGKGPGGAAIREIFPWLNKDPADYQTADYDSIWSRGDRNSLQNGLITLDQGGWTSPMTNIVSSSASPIELMDDDFGTHLGNGVSTTNGTQPARAYMSMDFGKYGLRIRGLKFFRPTMDGFWQLYGGINKDVCPFTVSDIFTIVPSIDGDGWNTYETLFTPGYDFPWPYMQLGIAIPSLLTNHFLGNELQLKVVHSELDGGDRRVGHAAASKQVIVTASSDFISLTASGRNAGWDGTIDGIYNTNQITKANLSFFTDNGLATGNKISNPGAWIMYQFPRSVTMREMVWMVNPLVGETGAGTKWGLWQWQGSNDNATWTNVGPQWHFGVGPVALTPCESMVAPDPGEGHADYLLWKMVLISGATCGQDSLNQIIFNLIDRGGQSSSPYRMDLSDNVDDGLTYGTFGFIAPGSPFASVALSDNIDDAINFTLTLTTNPVLRLDMSDGDSDALSFFSDIFPSMVGQTVVNATGR